MFPADDGLSSEGEIGGVVFAELLFILQFLPCHLIDFNRSGVVLPPPLVFGIVVANVGRVAFVAVVGVEGRIWIFSGAVADLFSQVLGLIVDLLGWVLLGLLRLPCLYLVGLDVFVDVLLLSGRTLEVVVVRFWQ